MRAPSFKPAPELAAAFNEEIVRAFARKLLDAMDVIRAEHPGFGFGINGVEGRSERVEFDVEAWQAGGGGRRFVLRYCTHEDSPQQMIESIRKAVADETFDNWEE